MVIVRNLRFRFHGTCSHVLLNVKHLHCIFYSKRAFQTQFRRWNFPPKQRPAYKNERLVSRIKELWERNLAQREMLRVLNEEDGFEIKARELMRVRAKNRWLLRVPNGENPRIAGTDDEDQTDSEVTRSMPSLPDLDRGSSIGSKSVMSGTGSDTQRNSDHGDDIAAAYKPPKQRRRRSKPSAGQSGSTNRFPSEMTLDEARLILTLDTATYRALRSNFQQICLEQDVSKKTTAGAERWEAVKSQLARQVPQVHSILWTNKDNTEARQLALDVICTDVTKRMRTMESRMTLAEAKNVLGVNPEQSRAMRLAFHQVLDDSGFTCKSDTTPQQWEELKRRWGSKSATIKKILADVRFDKVDNHGKGRALEVLAKDIMKRLRDERVRKDPNKSQHLPLSPAISPHTGQHARAARTVGRGRRSHSTEHLDMGEGMVGNNFDAMSEVSHASHMAFSPASSSIGAHMPISLQSQPSNVSDSQDSLPQPSQVLDSSLPHGLELDSQMDSSLLLGPNPQAAFMDQSYVQQQFTQSATSAPVFQQVPSVSTACAIYMRLHPSSSFVSSTSLWIATLNSQSVQELRHAAVEKFPNTICVRIEGVLKDGKGGELPLQIEQDQELSAYLAHLQGGAPTFNVQLVWKTS